MNKKFKKNRKFIDLKVGDTIYYYSHGVMHPQVISEISTKKKAYCRYGTGQLIEYNVLLIKCGRNSIIEIDDYYWNDVSCWANHSLRFANEKVAIDYMRDRQEEHEFNYCRFNNRLDKEKSLLDRCNENIRFLNEKLRFLLENGMMLNII